MILAILIFVFLEYSYNHNIEIFYRYGKEVFKLSSDDFHNKEEPGLNAINIIKQIFLYMYLPTSFKDISINDKNFDIMY